MPGKIPQVFGSEQNPNPRFAAKQLQIRAIGVGAEEVQNLQQNLALWQGSEAAERFRMLRQGFGRRAVFHPIGLQRELC